jgi:hypothetical protein
MQYLYAVLNSIAHNMTLIIVATLALIVLSTVLEWTVQMTTARSHAPARKVVYRNGTEVVEIECSNLQLKEILSTMRSTTHRQRQDPS